MSDAIHFGVPVQTEQNNLFLGLLRGVGLRRLWMWVFRARVHSATSVLRKCHEAEKEM